MMKKESITNNFIFQFLYQVIILVVPLVLSPYLTRTLGDTALGEYSYINSIAYYFVIFSMLGISRHGQRIISENINKESDLRRAFWSLLFVHAIVSLLSIILFFIFAFLFGNDSKIIYYTQGLYVASALFDITWFFYGLENFKSVVIKNTLVKIIECVLIFLLVKNTSDLWIYSLITASGILIGQVIMIPQAIKIAPPSSFSWVDIKQHFGPLLIFFVSVFASSLYTVFDKTLLGILTVKENVAYYEYSNKIINIPKVIIAVIGTVMFPRACKMAKENNIEGQRKYISYSFLATSMISMASIFGLAAISDLFAFTYFGEEFIECGKVMIALSPIIYIVGIGDILRTQYMIPNHMDKQFSICIVLNAIVNLILSISLIPILGIYGAVIGTVSAEIFGLIFQMVACRKFIKIRDFLENLIPFLIIGIAMFFVIKMVAQIFSEGIVSLIVQILVGGAFFIILTVIYTLIFRKELLKEIMAKFRKNRREQK